MSSIALARSDSPLICLACKVSICLSRLMLRFLIAIILLASFAISCCPKSNLVLFRSASLFLSSSVSSFFALSESICLWFSYCNWSISSCLRSKILCLVSTCMPYFSSSISISSSLKSFVRLNKSC